MRELLLVVTFGSNVIESRRIDKDKITIGRDDTNDIVLNNPTISRQHSEISFSDGIVSIKDLRSANGTFINNVKMDDAVLDIGDEIVVGKYMIKLKSARSLDPELDLSFQSTEEGKSTDIETFRVDDKTRKQMLERYQSGKDINFPVLILSNNKHELRRRAQNRLDRGVIGEDEGCEDLRQRREPAPFIVREQLHGLR